MAPAWSQPAGTAPPVSGQLQNSQSFSSPPSSKLSVATTGGKAVVSQSRSCRRISAPTGGFGELAMAPDDSVLMDLPGEDDPVIGLVVAPSAQVAHHISEYSGEVVRAAVDPPEGAAAPQPVPSGGARDRNSSILRQSSVPFDSVSSRQRALFLSSGCGVVSFFVAQRAVAIGSWCAYLRASRTCRT